jgi:hypothetical protein
MAVAGLIASTTFPVGVAAEAAPQQLSTLWQVCKFRETQIIQYNQALNRSNLALAAEKDRMRKDKLVVDIGALNRGLETAEQSWQRMDCSRLLYPLRP